MGDPVQPVNVDAVVEDEAHDSWSVLASEPRWQVWRDHNRRRPPSRAEKRGRVAAATAGTILGVLGVGGAITYAVQWQDLLNEATAQVWSDNPAQVVGSESNSTADMQLAIDRAQRANSGSSGLIAIVNGQVAGTTPNASQAATDQGFIREAVKKAEAEGGYPDSYTSLSSVCVYKVTSIFWHEGRAVVVNVVDLTPDRDRLNGAFLTFGLVGLGVAGVTGGAVWWRLGRQLNKKVEPEDV